MRVLHWVRLAFAGSRPFDWLMFAVELLVLLVIGWEAVASLRHRWLARKRRERIFECVSAGLALRGDRRNLRGVDEGQTGQWNIDVLVWQAETSILLKSYSPMAEALFSRNSPHPPQHYVEVDNAAIRSFNQLDDHISNLLDLLNRPDDYT